MLLLLLACDIDGDGFPDAVDCVEENPDIFPGQTELCDQLDNDCDGRIDEDPADGATFGWDGDGDGFGGPNHLLACTAPEGFVLELGDCDDANPHTYPGAEERCDGWDNDCDGTAEDPPVPWYPDTDDDGYGDPDVYVMSCATIYGHTTEGTDCDDSRPGVHPNAVEHCNNRDDDCDEVVDEDPIDALEWAPDGDGDGFGDAGQAVISCSEVAGSVGNADDCDDADSDIFPWADEVCDDGIDQDCSGVADNTCPVGWDVVTDASVWLESTSQRGARRVVVHDLDGDGTDDLVGGWHKDGGAVAVLSGPVTGSQAYTPAAVGAAGSDFGHELAIVGDALAVGAPLKDDVGAVYLFADGDLTEAFATVVGTVEDGALGRYGLVGGDLDGDGEGDLAASSSKSQATFVFMGPLSGALDQSNAHAQVKATGFEQLATGDLNGDGIDDLVSPYRTLSEVYGWYGPVTGELPTSDADIYLSGEASDYFGGAVAIGDHDGDGHGDLAVSGYYDSTGATQAGGVWVFDGPDQTESLHLFHTGSYAYLGSYNSGAVELHDLNDDGRDDLLVGAASDDLDETNSGSVFVVHGALGGGSLATDDADLIVTGGFYSYCGFGIAVGDLTGDGVPDLAVACRGYDGNASGVVSVNGFVSVLAGPLF